MSALPLPSDCLSVLPLSSTCPWVSPLSFAIGSWSEAESREALELCMGACLQLKAAMRDTLVQAAAGG